MKKSCRRKVWLPAPPRGMRPKLSDSKILDLALAHIMNLDDIAKGGASEDVLWQWVGGVLTWTLAANAMQIGAPEMAVQYELARAMIDRLNRTNKVGFSGPEYQTAKDGVAIMDSLAEIVDLETAVQAAIISQDAIDALISQRGQD